MAAPCCGAVTFLPWPGRFSRPPTRSGVGERPEEAPRCEVGKPSAPSTLATVSVGRPRRGPACGQRVHAGALLSRRRLGVADKDVYAAVRAMGPVQECPCTRPRWTEASRV